MLSDPSHDLVSSLPRMLCPPHSTLSNSCTTTKYELWGEGTMIIPTLHMRKEKLTLRNLPRVPLRTGNQAPKPARLTNILIYIEGHK